MGPKQGVFFWQEGERSKEQQWQQLHDNPVSTIRVNQNSEYSHLVFLHSHLVQDGSAKSHPKV
jgi:hypothetical protein